MPNRIRRSIALMALIALMSACGGSETGDAADRQASPVPTRAATGGTTPDPAGEAAGGLASADCREYAAALSGFTPDPSNPSGFGNFRQVADLFDELADKVTNEISGDFRIVARAYREFAEVSADVDLSNPAAMATLPPEELQRIQQSLQGLDTEQVRTAVGNIERFVEEHCGQE